MVLVRIEEDDRVFHKDVKEILQTLLDLLEGYCSYSEPLVSHFQLTKKISVGIKSLLDAARITAAQIYVNTALM
ncbi:hypothetical protein Tco_0284277, partial [Tanacetum coccineum]